MSLYKFLKNQGINNNFFFKFMIFTSFYKKIQYNKIIYIFKKVIILYLIFQKSYIKFKNYKKSKNLI